MTGCLKTKIYLCSPTWTQAPQTFLQYREQNSVHITNIEARVIFTPSVSQESTYICPLFNVCYVGKTYKIDFGDNIRKGPLKAHVHKFKEHLNRSLSSMWAFLGLPRKVIFIFWVWRLWMKTHISTLFVSFPRYLSSILKKTVEFVLLEFEERQTLFWDPDDRQSSLSSGSRERFRG